MRVVCAAGRTGARSGGVAKLEPAAAEGDDLTNGHPTDPVSRANPFLLAYSSCYSTDKFKTRCRTLAAFHIQRGRTRDLAGAEGKYSSLPSRGSLKNAQCPVVEKRSGPIASSIAWRLLSSATNRC